MNKAQTHRPITGAQVIEFPPIEEGTRLECNIEARLQELTNFAEGFSDTTSNLFLAENASVREATEELLVKGTALRWIIRIAKRSTGRLRVSLWADIDRVLTDLENTAAWVMRAEEKRLIRV